MHRAVGTAAKGAIREPILYIGVDGTGVKNSIDYGNNDETLLQVNFLGHLSVRK